MFRSLFAIISLFFLFSSSSFASGLTGLELLSASNASLQEASTEIDSQSIFTWETKLDGESEIVVDVISVDDLQLSYGCHLHGSSLACHKEESSQGKNSHPKEPSVTLKFMQDGNLLALNKFKKTMKKKGKDLGVMTSYKVWTHKDDHAAGHGDGADVWTKINYFSDGMASEVFVLCHVHGNETEFVCHYVQSGEGEPSIGL